MYIRKERTITQEQGKTEKKEKEKKRKKDGGKGSFLLPFRSFRSTFAFFFFTLGYLYILILTSGIDTIQPFMHMFPTTRSGLKQKFSHT